MRKVVIDCENWIYLVLRDSKKRFILGMGGDKIELYDQSLVKISSESEFQNTSCGLIHNGLIFLGGANGISVFDEVNFKQVKSILPKNAK